MELTRREFIKLTGAAAAGAIATEAIRFASGLNEAQRKDFVESQFSNAMPNPFDPNRVACLSDGSQERKLMTHLIYNELREVSKNFPNKPLDRGAENPTPVQLGNAIIIAETADSPTLTIGGPGLHMGASINARDNRYQPDQPFATRASFGSYHTNPGPEKPYPILGVYRTKEGEKLVQLYIGATLSPDVVDGNKHVMAEDLHVSTGFGHHGLEVEVMDETGKTLEDENVTKSITKLMYGLTWGVRAIIPKDGHYGFSNNVYTDMSKDAPNPRDSRVGIVGVRIGTPDPLVAEVVNSSKLKGLESMNMHME